MKYVALLTVILLAAPAWADKPDRQSNGDQRPSRAEAAEIRAQCQGEADRRMQQEPAVASGLTSYLPTVRARFLSEFLRRNGLSG